MEDVVLAYNGLPLRLYTDTYTVANDYYYNTGELWKFDLQIGSATLSFSYYGKTDFKDKDQGKCTPGYYQNSSFYKYKNGGITVEELTSGTVIGTGQKHLFPINIFENNDNWGFKLGTEGDLIKIKRLFPKTPYNEYYYNKYYEFKIKNDPDPNINQPLRYRSPEDYPPVKGNISSSDYSKVDVVLEDRSDTAPEWFYKKNFGDHIAGWGVSEQQKQAFTQHNIFICWKISHCKENVEKLAIESFQTIYDAFDDKTYNNNPAPYDALQLCDRIVGEILLNWGYFYIHSGKTKFNVDPILPTSYSEEYEAIINQYYNSLVNFYINTYYRTAAQIFPNDTGTLKERSDRRIKYLISILPSSAIGIIPIPHRVEILKMLVNNALYNKDELIALTIIKSVTFPDADEFLGLLLSESVKWNNSNVTLFEALYRRIDDRIMFFGEDNRKAYMLTMYMLWFVSSYNPMNSDTDTDELSDTYEGKPVTLKYESELFFGFYMDNMNFVFKSNNIEAQEEKIEVVPTYKEYQSGIRKTWVSVGVYNIYQAITLNEYKDEDVAIKIPLIGLNAAPNGETQALLPLFFLKYIDDRGDKEDLWTGIGLALDVALTFTGIGNITKLRHLRYLSKIGQAWRGAITGSQRVFLVRSAYYSVQGVAGTFEFTASLTQLFRQYYMNGTDCATYHGVVDNNVNDATPEGQIPDELPSASEEAKKAYKRCKAIDNILFWMQMGSLGMDIYASRMIRKKAKELADLGYPPAWDTGQYLELKVRFQQLNNGVDVLGDYENMINLIPSGSVISGKLTTDIDKINFFNDFGMVQRDNAFWAQLTKNSGEAVDNWKQFRNLDITDEITNVVLLADNAKAAKYIAYYGDNNLKSAIASLDRTLRDKFIVQHGGLTPLPGGPGFIKAWTKMTGDALGEFANNVPVLRQFDNMTDDMIDSIVYEMKHDKRGGNVRTLIKESPSDINNVMRPWLQDPAFAYAAKDNTNARWQKWRKSIFAKHKFGLGNKFEKLCNKGLKRRLLPGQSGIYNTVKNKIISLTGKNIDDYELFTGVQLKIGTSENYFVADQLFVKYEKVGKARVIKDIIVVETKLQTATNLSPRQLEALQNATQGFYVRSKKASSKYNKNIKLNQQSEKLKFNGSPTFIKMFDDANGNAINDLSLL